MKKLSLLLPMNSKTREAWFSFGAILLCWALFLILLRYVWPYEGIAYMEELTGSAAYAWIHQIPNMMPVPYIHLFGREIPAMFTAWLGPWNIYLLSPFIAVGGCTLATLRSYSAFMFLFALWGTWRLALLLNNDKTTAFLSIALLAVCPAMITTRSLFVTAPDVAASVWTLYFAVLFARTRKSIYAYTACAAFFIGLGARSWVAGLGVGLALYIALTWRHVLALLPKSNALKARLIIGCLACAGAILLPAIAYNASHGWPTIKFYVYHLVTRAWWCAEFPGTCSNLNYWANLKTSLSQLCQLSDGTVILPEPWHWLYILPLFISFLYTVRDARHRRTLWSVPAMLWIVAIGYILVSPISPTEQIPIHFAPLAPILCALMFSWLGIISAGLWRRTALLAMALVCAAQFAGDFHLLNRANIDMDTIGYYVDSPLLIKASQWTGERAKIPIVSCAMPVTLAAPYFSQNRARLMPWPAWSGSPYLPWEDWLRSRDKPYFIVENDRMGLQPAAQLRAQAAKFDIPLTLVKVFRDSLGRPAFEVYQVR